MYTKIRIYIPHLRDTDRRRSHQPGICILYLRVYILHIRSVCYIHTRHGPPMVTSARYIVYYIYVYKYRYSRAHYTRVKVTFSTCPSWGFCAARPSHTKYVSSTVYADRILYGELYEVQFKSIDSDAPGDISLVYGFDTHTHTERERETYTMRKTSSI